MPSITEPITGQSVDATEDAGYFSLTLTVDTHTLKLKLPSDYASWSSDPLFIQNRHLLAGALLNGRTVAFDLPDYTLLTKGSAIVNNASQAPINPQQKFDFLLLRLAN